MTKTTKILTSTLLASSVIAFSAHASSDYSVDIHTYSKAKHRVIPAEVVEVSAPMKILDAGTLSGAAKMDAKTAAELKKTVEQAARANTFAGAKAYEGKKYTITTTNVAEVSSHKIVTVPADSRRSNIFGTLDVLNAKVQEDISERRSNIYADSVQQMADVVALLKGLRTAYETVRAKETYIRSPITKEDYWTAMKIVHDEFFPKINASSNIHDPKSDELKHVKTGKLAHFIATLNNRGAEVSEAPAEKFTTLDKSALHKELMTAFENGGYRVANATYKRGLTKRTVNVNEAHVNSFIDTETANYASRTVKTDLTPAEQKYEKKAKKSRVTDTGAEFMGLEGLIFDATLANSMSSAWTLYQDILTGKATYKEAAPLVESAKADGAAVEAAKEEVK